MTFPLWLGIVLVFLAVVGACVTLSFIASAAYIWFTGYDETHPAGRDFRV